MMFFKNVLGKILEKYVAAARAALLSQDEYVRGLKTLLYIAEGSNADNAAGGIGFHVTMDDVQAMSKTIAAFRLMDIKKSEFAWQYEKPPKRFRGSLVDMVRDGVLCTSDYIRGLKTLLYQEIGNESGLRPHQLGFDPTYEPQKDEKGGLTFGDLAAAERTIFFFRRMNLRRAFGDADEHELLFELLKFREVSAQFFGLIDQFERKTAAPAAKAILDAQKELEEHEQS